MRLSAGNTDCFLVSLVFLFFSLDVAPLSAPAFSFCFPLLNAMLRESSGSTEETENLMTRALQVVSEHSQLRAETDMDDIVIDEVETNVSIAFLHKKMVGKYIIYVKKKKSNQCRQPELTKRNRLPCTPFVSAFI